MKWVIGGGLVIALILAIAVTLATGEFCETARCAPNVTYDASYSYSYYGWPKAWKTDTPGDIIDQFFFEAYWSYDTNGISYFFFVLDTVVFSLMIASVELLLFAPWLLRRMMRHLSAAERRPTPRTS